MQKTPLFQEYDTLSRMNRLPLDVPLYVSKNLNQNFSIRNYQQQAFARFLDYNNPVNPLKQKPVHLLFNMATGSGKTFVMAGLILELYEKGYRNFLFFVNSSNIIGKTKENFLNSNSSKYLFSEKIEFNGKIVDIKEVDNFSSDGGESINIKFTTIQGLHSDLNAIKENALSYDDFERNKIVMLSDEAHHINATTKKEKLGVNDEREKTSWEQTIMKILTSHSENILLEFTATIDLANELIAEKYRDKIIYKYDLSEFRIDGYSKEVDILKADMPQKQRVLQSLILSQYRLKVAENNNIALKPVILFKAQKKIDESKQQLADFNEMIKNLKVSDIEEIKNISQVDIVKRAFAYFTTLGVSLQDIVDELRDDFAPENCISANDSDDLVSIKLNTLEDKNNRMRAVFAVAKLNEGWDVLNLFDIVRMYDARDGKWIKNGEYQAGKTTLSEAQLIGRWARYFPFTTSDNLGEEKYKRKFDGTKDELKILETFYYHSFFDSKYISEITRALVKSGMMEDFDKKKDFPLRFKQEFKDTNFYKEAVVFSNKRREKDYSEVDSIEKLWLTTKEYEFKDIFTGKTDDITVFEQEQKNENLKIEIWNILVSDIDAKIVRKALQRNNFYRFENLKKYLWKLASLEEFMTDKNYLWAIKIYFSAPSDILEGIVLGKDTENIIKSLSWLLFHLEREIKDKKVEYEGEKVFSAKALSEYDFEKTLKVDEGEEGISIEKDWFAFEEIIGTSEEEHFLERFKKQIEDLNKNHEDIYLVRNERTMAIHSFEKGERFEPDFLLFMKDKSWWNGLSYQVFIEPKWDHLLINDKWKEDFLLQIDDSHQILEMDLWTHKLVGLPFYNKNTENIYIDAFDKRFLKD